ncbi:MAG: glycine--tRNA ligase subunit beta, partial [Thermodesulfobacteriota bacterium]
ADKLAASVNGQLFTDSELIETVVNIVEYPIVLMGEFEKKYLNLPKEVLISVMKNHQKYFPVYKNGSDDLLPYFIFVCGTKVKDNKVVIKGNERVLRARLNDAEFFWNEDIKNPLGNNLEKLKSMVFLSEIGNYYEKTKRLEMLSEQLSILCGKEKIKDDLKRAAALSKADLVSQMVFEFPELQGTMGKYYAKESGEKEAVAKAIEEHYMPTGRDGNLPKTEIGALLSITDKIDNICSCFKANLKPTGSADPYALRRQSIGIIQIVLDKKLNFSLKLLVEKANVIDFISERFKNLMLDEGYTNNVIDSVLSTGFDNIFDSYNKMKAVEKFRKQKDFDELAVAFKRVVNIAKDKPKAKLDIRLFKDKSETNLYKSFSDIKDKTDKYFENKGLTTETDFLNALNLIKTLKEPIDNFFDNVMVMDKDETLKNNRLALLNEIKTLFFQISDFSKI